MQVELKTVPVQFVVEVWIGIMLPFLWQILKNYNFDVPFFTYTL